MEYHVDNLIRSSENHTQWSHYSSYFGNRKTNEAELPKITARYEQSSGPHLMISHSDRIAPAPGQWCARLKDVLAAGRILLYTLRPSECTVGFPLVLQGSGWRLGLRAGDGFPSLFLRAQNVYLYVCSPLHCLLKTCWVTVVSRYLLLGGASGYLYTYEITVCLASVFIGFPWKTDSKPQCHNMDVSLCFPFKYQAHLCVLDDCVESLNSLIGCESCYSSFTYKWKTKQNKTPLRSFAHILNNSNSTTHHWEA